MLMGLAQSSIKCNKYLGDIEQALRRYATTTEDSETMDANYVRGIAIHTKIKVEDILKQYNPDIDNFDRYLAEHANIFTPQNIPKDTKLAIIDLVEKVLRGQDKIFSQKAEALKKLTNQYMEQVRKRLSRFDDTIINSRITDSGLGSLNKTTGMLITYNSRVSQLALKVATMCGIKTE